VRREHVEAAAQMVGGVHEQRDEEDDPRGSKQLVVSHAGTSGPI
jgi:hypothetical protein